MTTINRYDSLDGEIVLVTSATRGIGEQTAGQLAEEGATVYAVARDAAKVSAEDQRPVELNVSGLGAYRPRLAGDAQEPQRGCGHACLVGDVRTG